MQGGGILTSSSERSFWQSMVIQWVHKRAIIKFPYFIRHYRKGYEHDYTIHYWSVVDSCFSKCSSFSHVIIQVYLDRLKKNHKILLWFTCTSAYIQCVFVKKPQNHYKQIQVSKTLQFSCKIFCVPERYRSSLVNLIFSVTVIFKCWVIDSGRPIAVAIVLHV